MSDEPQSDYDFRPGLAPWQQRPTTPANEPQVYSCRCNWCGRDFTETRMITNTCPDCRSRAQHAYDVTLKAIRDERQDTSDGN